VIADSFELWTSNGNPVENRPTEERFEGLLQKESPTPIGDAPDPRDSHTF